MKKLIAISLFLLGVSLANAQLLRYDGISKGRFEFSKPTTRHTTLHILAECGVIGTNVYKINGDESTWRSGCSALGDFGEVYTNGDPEQEINSYIVIDGDTLVITHRRGEFLWDSYLLITDTYETAK